MFCFAGINTANSPYSMSLHCTNVPSHVILWWKWLTAWENGVKDVRSCEGYKFLVWMSDNSLVSERRSQHPSWCQSFIPQYLHQSPQYLNISPPIFTLFVVYASRGKKLHSVFSTQCFNFLSSPNPKSGPLRPKPKPRSVLNQNSSPIGTGVTQ